MKPEDLLKERLERIAATAPVQDPPIEQIARSARRHSVVRGMSVAIVIAGLGGSSVWGLSALSGVRKDEPVGSLSRIVHVPVGGRPIGSIQVGDGAAWVIVHKGGAGPPALVRVDAATFRANDITAAGEAERVALGAGSVWVATCATSKGCVRYIVRRIDPRTFRVQTEIPIPGDLVGQIGFGFGSLWVPVRTVRTENSWSLLRIDAATNRIIATIAGCCSEVAVGEAGVWGIRTGTEISRIDPRDNRIAATVSLRHPGPRDLWSIPTVGEGAVWVVAGRGLGTTPLDRIDPANNRITRIPDVGFGELAAGAGYVWMARCETQRPCIQLLRVDPATNAVVQPIQVVKQGPPPAHFVCTCIGGPVLSVGVGEGAVWIGDETSFEVIAVPLDQAREFTGS
jgi:hypothetical protein